MLENRNDLLEIKQAEILSIIERTSISLREEDISSKDVLQSFFKSGGTCDNTSTTRASYDAHVGGRLFT